MSPFARVNRLSAALLVFGMTFAAALPAAADNSRTQAASSDDDGRSDKICTREKRLGSNRVEVVCRSREQVEAAKADAREEMRRRSDRH